MIRYIRGNGPEADASVPSLEGTTSSEPILVHERIHKGLPERLSDHYLNTANVKQAMIFCRGSVACMILILSVLLSPSGLDAQNKLPDQGRCPPRFIPGRFRYPGFLELRGGGQNLRASSSAKPCAAQQDCEVQSQDTPQGESNLMRKVEELVSRIGDKRWGDVFRRLPALVEKDIGHSPAMHGAVVTRFWKAQRYVCSPAGRLVGITVLRGSTELTCQHGWLRQ